MPCRCKCDWNSSRLEVDEAGGAFGGAFDRGAAGGHGLLNGHRLLHDRDYHGAEWRERGNPLWRGAAPEADALHAGIMRSPRDAHRRLAETRLLVDAPLP